MCPGAVSVPAGDEENLYNHVVANEIYDDDIEMLSIYIISVWTLVQQQRYAFTSKFYNDGAKN
eukprot:gene8417-17348_t